MTNLLILLSNPYTKSGMRFIPYISLSEIIYDGILYSQGFDDIMMMWVIRSNIHLKVQYVVSDLGRVLDILHAIAKSRF